MDRFKNQVAVISGGADGLGFGIGERIASEGGDVVLLDINEQSLTAAVERLKAKNLFVRGLKLNVASQAEVENTMTIINEEMGRIDIMVNSAGIVGPTNICITEYSVEDYDRVYQVNLRGAFLMSKFAIKYMQANNYGRILLISSMAGKDGNPFMAGYTSMKAGVIGLVKGIGKEFANTGITINGLAPAVIKTKMNDETDSKQLAYMKSKIPMGRFGTVEEVASLASWIVSQEASFNTGFVFDLSGGRATY
jgi:2-dehydro-3-deoxy-L-rhamnonate dehydrogenase (NAD+)